MNTEKEREKYNYRVAIIVKTDKCFFSLFETNMLQRNFSYAQYAMHTLHLHYTANSNYTLLSYTPHKSILSMYHNHPTGAHVTPQQ